MQPNADPDRFAYEGDDPDAPNTEAQEKAERFDEIVDTTIVEAVRAMRRLLEARMISTVKPGFIHEVFGAQPAFQLSDEQIIEQVAAEVRGALCAWLKDEIRELAEQ